ncbi:DUF2125 domain-containing protein [Oceaniglobus roseus]|uniref:DUF2125 domain-containing protein n=1 Tax=Oceaniglobus roseus TaxID=1737570 RepID=UPI000C7EBCAF|nr:DUF2125 domain-containing protein [Kandeliimicrobium roseum]
MRKLLVVILVAAAAWSGYWFVGSSAVERGLTAWFAAQETRGWTADYSSLATRGFPNRFDTTIENVELADPATGLGWSAPFVQILALSYNPTKIILAFPHTQTIATPAEEITLDSSQMRASVAFVPGTDLELDHLTAVADAVAVSSDTGWGATMEQLRFATRPATGVQHAHDIALAATDIAPSEVLRARLDPAVSLPEKVQSITVATTVGFDGPWNHFTLSDAHPKITSLDVTETRIDWGDMSLRAAGRLTPDANGRAEGEITVKATEWRQMVGVAVSLGLVPGGASDRVIRALELMARGTGDAKVLELPLTFADGRVSLGPVPLGPAPFLVR